MRRPAAGGAGGGRAGAARWLLPLALAFAGLPAEAQDTPGLALPEPASQLRQMIEQQEVVVVVRRKAWPAIALEGGGSLTVSAVGAFEPGGEDRRTLGLRIDVARKGVPADDGRFYLDPHDADQLLRALAQLESVAAEAASVETEADFATNEGLVVGVRAKGGSTRYHVLVDLEEAPVEAGLSKAGFRALRKNVEGALQGLFN